jgi:NAD(P)-dependent dehydrogenase (short-subunit alcohol dehydrogenase family)
MWRFAGAYCSIKAALTALFDSSLRMELAPFGIKVVTVQPGSIKSSLSGNADKDLDRFRKTPYGPIQSFIDPHPFFPSAVKILSIC